MNITVSDIRRAIASLPDDAPVILECVIQGGDPDDIPPYIGLAGVEREGDRLVIGPEVIVAGGDDDEDDDMFDDEEV